MKSRRGILASIMLLSLLAGGGVCAQGSGGAVYIPMAATTTAGAQGQEGPSSWVEGSWQIEMVDAPKAFRFLGNRSLAWDNNGHAHVAYGSDRLYYAWHDGVSWQLSTVDDGPGVGLFTSLALDASAAPRIAYFDQMEEQLKYASFDGAVWHTEVVAPADWCTWEDGVAALALDAAGRPRILYCGPAGDLRYAQHDGSAWQTERVASSADFPALALDAAGRPHVSYNGSGGLTYAFHDGTVWQFETLDTSASYTSLALDPAGHPHISAYNSLPDSVWYFYHDGLTWHSQTIAAAYVRGSTSLALDGDGHAYVSFVDRNLRQLMMAFDDGAAWQVQFVAEASYSNATQNTSLALDGAGRPHIAYLKDYDLNHAYDDGSAWQVETVDLGGDVGRWSALALDGAGRPHISYCDRANGDLKYACYDGTAWQTQTVDSAGVVGYYTSLALDSADRPHIAYCRMDPDNPSLCMDLVYARYDGTSWITTTVNTGYMGQYASLALDAADRPHISYYNSSNSQVRYAAYDGSAWHIEVIADDVGTQLEGTSLALSSAGLPHIAYYDGHQLELRYARYDGADWQTETVDDDYYAGWACSLALDGTDRPHISYYHDNDKAVKYAHYDGSDWWIETVGPSFYLAGYTSLALDAGGRPHISFLGWTPTYGLIYAFRGASGWVTELVDHDSTGRYNSLALDAAGNPHISYFDDLDSDLRYAYRSCHPVRTVHIAGPTSLPVGVAGTYEATYEPPTATVSLITWDNGMIGPDATYDWAVTGTHTVVATATTACGEAQGHLDVAVFCQEVTGLTVSGPPVLAVNQLGTYQAAVQPVTASQPLTLRWDNGTEGDSASYSWATTGTYTLAVTATNVCGPGPEASWEVRVIAAWPHHVYLPMLVRQTQ